MRAWMSWSSGKDSTAALQAVREDPDVTVTGLLVTVNADADRVAMHAVRRTLLEAQADRLGLPLHVVEIPASCPNELYERRMSDAMAVAKQENVQAVVFGDLFLDDVRTYREQSLAGSGVRPIFPLWGLPTDQLARKMIASGIKALLTCVDPEKLPPSFAGRAFDVQFLDDLPPDVDPCGERGEFHTFVWCGPGFARPINVRTGEVVTRDGFVFCDVLPTEASTQRHVPAHQGAR